MTMDWEMYDKILKECKKLGLIKNKNYGSESLKLFNGIAVLSRMNDKIQRLNTMYEVMNSGSTKTFAEPHEESVDDTLKDLINYAVYLIMLRRGGIQ